MKLKLNKLFLFLLLVLFKHDEMCQAEMTCQGFNSPSLAVELRDALSNELIEKAQVYYSSKNSQTTVIAFDKERKAFFTWLGESDLLDLRVEHPEYKNFRDPDFKIEINVLCGGKNDWVYKVYLCPLGEDCSKGPASHKVPPGNS